MYFPFLRGKQFELIALREIIDVLKENKNKSSLVIEPVKDSSTLRTTLKKFRDHDINFTLIANPIEGDLISKTKDIFQLLRSSMGNSLIDYDNFQVGVYVRNEKEFSKQIKALSTIDFQYKGFTLIHIGEVQDHKVFDKISSIGPTRYNLINFNKTSRRYYRNFDSATRISLDDYFIPQQRNADYQHYTDEPFSEEHKYYEEDGFQGFSDYLTIGEPYSDGGFLPYAVAIHLTYATEDSKIRVKHFVSDSNEDSTDVAGKFAEALKKLIAWVDLNNPEETLAIREFRDLYKNGHFPGLGSIKKLSIMNHIELVLSLI